MNAPTTAARPTIPVGTPVEVRNRFCSAWSRGFAVADAADDGYTLRRQSDGYVLPARFAAPEVRRIG